VLKSQDDSLALPFLSRVLIPFDTACPEFIEGAVRDYLLFFQTLINTGFTQFFCLAPPLVGGVI
jgi:hypothetical protein